MRNGYSNGTHRSNGFRRDAGLNDLKIAHAIKATQVSKPYPKIKHAGARYVVVNIMILHILLLLKFFWNLNLSELIISKFQLI